MRKLLVIHLFLIASAGLFFFSCKNNKPDQPLKPVIIDSFSWSPPAETSIPDNDEGRLIKYGKELIANTAMYLGPKGSVAQVSNGMNCQNCHLKAGQQLYANPFCKVAATYPRFSARSGGKETLVKKIDDCMERSMNGKKLDSLSTEMRAMIAYINWVGSNVSKKDSIKGVGSEQLAFLDRAADPAKGTLLYQQHCQKCHGTNGAGMLASNKVTYVYPPLWGEHSYNVSAGMYRITRLAGFIKNNMPYGADHKHAQLSSEQAWDIAAFVNSKQRPEKFFKQDWPVIAAKPVDYPFGPFSDSFSEFQHKYGPFAPISKSKKAAASNTKS